MERANTGLQRVALVGAGYFAAFHLDAWTRLPGVELAAVVDLDADKRDAFAATARAAGENPQVVASLADVEGELDIIDIATPPASHLALVEAASARAPIVICQKPLADTLAESVAVVEAAECAGATLVVHENFRFSPWYREMRRLLDVGTLGTLHAVSTRLRPGDGQGPGAYLDRQPYFQQMPRFLVHETAIHLIDVFRFLAGEVTGVSARLRRLNPAIAGEDAGYIVFDFANGAGGLFDGNRLNDHVSDNTRRTMGETWLEGARGVLRLDGMGALYFKPHGGAEHEHVYEWQEKGFAGDSVYLLCKHVADHALTPTLVENLGRDYLRNLEVEEAVYRSASEGIHVTLTG